MLLIKKCSELLKPHLCPLLWRIADKGWNISLSNGPYSLKPEATVCELRKARGIRTRILYPICAGCVTGRDAPGDIEVKYAANEMSEFKVGQPGTINFNKERGYGGIDFTGKNCRCVGSEGLACR